MRATKATRHIYESLVPSEEGHDNQDINRNLHELLEAARMCSLTAAQRGNIVAALWAARKRDALKALLEHPEFAHHSTLERAAGRSCSVRPSHLTARQRPTGLRRE